MKTSVADAFAVDFSLGQTTMFTHRVKKVIKNKEIRSNSE